MSASQHTVVILFNIISGALGPDNCQSSQQPTLQPPSERSPVIWAFSNSGADTSCSGNSSNSNSGYLLHTLELAFLFV